jgi:hypothetical protein
MVQMKLATSLLYLLLKAHWLYGPVRKLTTCTIDKQHFVLLLAFVRVFLHLSAESVTLNHPNLLFTTVYFLADFFRVN